MKGKKILNNMSKRVQKIKTSKIETNFPEIIEDLIYIWNDLIYECEELSEDEFRDNIYEINKQIITYFAELVKIYAKEKYGITFNYEIDEITSLGGSAAYNSKENKIMISVMANLIHAINTSSYLQTILHEVEHIRQHNYYKKTGNNYPSYFSSIEKHYYLIQELSKIDDDFYNNNYKNLYTEVDAEESSIKMLKELIPFLEEKGIKKIDYLKVEKIKKQIEEDIEEIEEDLISLGRIKNQASKKLYEDSTRNLSFILCGEEISSDDLIKKVIEKNKPVLKETESKEKGLLKTNTIKMF